MSSGGEVLRRLEEAEVGPAEEGQQTSSYRPICLLDTMGKLLKELILQRLRALLVGENGLSESQFGFRKGRSTVDAIRAVVNIATNARKETGKRKVFCALISIDIRNAFNTARWNICIEAMVRKKVPDYLLRIIDDYLSDRWVIYQGDNWSLKKDMTCGALKGRGWVHSFGTSCMTISCAWTYLLESASSASRMTHLSCAPLMTSES